MAARCIALLGAESTGKTTLSLELAAHLQALETAGVLPAGSAPRPQDDGTLGQWVATCEKCSDPECEHRLFSRLREARG